MVLFSSLFGGFASETVREKTMNHGRLRVTALNDDLPRLAGLTICSRVCCDGISAADRYFMSILDWSSDFRIDL
jgi:hypothetical protein